MRKALAKVFEACALDDVHIAKVHKHWQANHKEHRKGRPYKEKHTRKWYLSKWHYYRWYGWSYNAVKRSSEQMCMTLALCGGVVELFRFFCSRTYC